MQEPILVWRDSTRRGPAHGGYCIYCSRRLEKFESDTSPYVFIWSCSFCGWGSRLEYFDDHNESTILDDSAKILRTLSLDSAELSLGELGLYISRNMDAVGRLAPRRFEELVGDVFRHHGFDVILTKQSRDGGYDLILMNSPDDFAIVEVKRHKNKVGVDLVRQLRGVQLRENAKRAILVTSGGFTRDAVKEAAHENVCGLELDLVAAEELLRMLEVYNKYAPSLVEASRIMKSDK